MTSRYEVACMVFDKISKEELLREKERIEAEILAAKDLLEDIERYMEEHYGVGV